MKIQQLELQNFRCFEHKIFDFSDQFNVIIGDNGTGKTAFSDALRLIIGVFIYRLAEIRENTFQDKSRIQDSDIRQVRNQKIECKLPVGLFCKSIINDISIQWSTTLIEDNGAYGRTPHLSPNLIQIVDSLREKVNNSQKINLPLISYYGTGRLWTIKKEYQEYIDLKYSPIGHSRFWGYTESLDPRSNLVIDWFRFEEPEILLGQQSITIHQAISNALYTCQIDNWIEMNYDSNEDTLVVKSRSGNSQHFTKLSDGVKNMLGMVADITYRAAKLNPHLGADVSKQTPGIVLIDEIDLHLHPKWQRRVVEDLKRTFPKIQFFATTHSPFIIQSLRDGELIDLNNSDLIPAAEYENKYTEYIMENVMHVPNTNRNERHQQMMNVAERYYQILENANNTSPEELEKLKTKLDELIEPYSDDVAYYAFLKMKRLAKLGE
ncbi:AAA family ATPase [Anabaena cylindrica UHCC 0172]|uniref:AAA family ATPase n=1 Tax=Anabaena cylindrica TaxID=1165 RepID=UPI002B215F1E|nr:AAA family ATPase [Anabaena cylindrica]MEA5553138.1 AAA family ATPase [Anabaena cylindrica UHCC 0172]